MTPRKRGERGRRDVAACQPVLCDSGQGLSVIRVSEVSNLAFGELLLTIPPAGLAGSPNREERQHLYRTGPEAQRMPAYLRHQWVPWGKITFFFPARTFLRAASCPFQKTL